MMNMSHCRFENTLKALRECTEHWEDDLSNDFEVRARKRLIELCKDIAEEFSDDLDEEYEGE